MKWANSFWRKVIYIGIMVALVFPLAYLGMPSMQLPDGTSTTGGLIAQKRAEHRLTQADLGEIDPASETMRLASVGMQGVATLFLWEAANEYKKRSDWDNLSATLNQLIKLQPNFSAVWEHQSWNMAYNVSVEFDDYRQRYHWVCRGIEFLIKGIHANRNDTKLVSYNAWMLGNKIGRSDEHLQFRKLFNKDNEFHKILRDKAELRMENARDHEGLHDNWLVSREMYLKAEGVHKAGNPINRESPLLFYSHVPMSIMDYAQALVEEGKLDDETMLAWERASKEWDAFGQVTIPTTWGVEIHLSDGDRGGADNKGLGGRIAVLRAKFDAFTKITRDQMIAERRATLTEGEKAALDTPVEKRTAEQHQTAYPAEQKMAMTHEEVALRSPESTRSEARIMAAQLTLMEDQERYIRQYRQIVNFDYWRTRAEVEQTQTAINARKFAREGDRYFLDITDFEKAKENYEKAWTYWAEIYEKYPSLIEDANSDDVFDQVKRYREVLNQREEPFPADFKLKKLIDYKKPNWQTSTAKKEKPGDKKPGDKKPEEKKPEEKKPEVNPSAEKSPEKKPEEKKPEEKKPAVTKPEPPTPPEETVEEKKP